MKRLYFALLALLALGSILAHAQNFGNMRPIFFGGGDSTGEPAEVIAPLFYYEPGDAGYTLTRASDAYYNNNGTLATVTNNTLRDNAYFTNPVGGALERTALVEAEQRTNIVLYSEDLSQTGTWAQTGTPSPTGSVTSPDGTASAYRLTDNDGVANEYITQTPTFTGNAVKAIAVFMKEGSSAPASGSRIQLRDETLAADRLFMVVTWSGGVPSVAATTGTFLKAFAIGSGWYRLLFKTAAVTAANTNSLRLHPATADAEQGDALFWGVHAEDDTNPSSYIKTTSAIVSRAVEDWQMPVTFTPEQVPFTIYLKYIEPADPSLGGNILHIGEGSLSDNGHVNVLYSGSRPRFYVVNGTTEIANPAGNVSIGDQVEFRAVLRADYSPLAEKSLNGGSSTTATSAAVTPFTAWNGSNVMTLGILEDGTANEHFVAYQKIIVSPGDKTMAQMRATTRTQVATLLYLPYLNWRYYLREAA